MSPLPAPGAMLAELVALPSASSFDPAADRGNRAVVDRLAAWAADLGAAVRVQELEGPAPRANLVATFGAGTDGLVLAGHADTVAADPAAWATDPLRLVETDGRLYGLGACDMKGFFVAALHAAARFDPARLRAPLHLVATADEECAMEGIRALAASGPPRARWAVVGEPTGLTPVRAHKGVLMERLVLHGREAHSSDPAAGASAIEGMVRALAALLAWRDELQAAHRDAAFAVPTPTLHPGVLRGGDRPNRVCARCELQFDLRSLPGMDPEELRVEICARVARAVAGTGLRFELRSLYPGTPALATPPDAALVRAAEEICGRPATTAAYGTEAPWFAAAGMETIVLGPGDIARAHRPDEFVTVDELDAAADLYARLIGRACGGTAEGGGRHAAAGGARSRRSSPPRGTDRRRRPASGPSRRRRAACRTARTARCGRRGGRGRPDCTTTPARGGSSPGRCGSRRSRPPRSRCRRNTCAVWRRRPGCGTGRPPVRRALAVRRHPC